MHMQQSYCQYLTNLLCTSCELQQSVKSIDTHSIMLSLQMHVLGGDTDLLGNSFDVDLLPTEFGGTAGNYNTHSWTDTMISSTNDDR